MCIIVAGFAPSPLVLRAPEPATDDAVAHEDLILDVGEVKVNEEPTAPVDTVVIVEQAPPTPVRAAPAPADAASPNGDVRAAQPLLNPQRSWFARLCACWK